MIDVYYGSSPNGYKVLILLEELEIPYRIVPVDLNGDLPAIPGFLEASPDGRIPAIVDHQPDSGAGPPCSVFESGAILLYLAQKTGRFLPKDPASRLEVMKWLFWQVATFGPVLGQLGYFRNSRSPQEEVVDYFVGQATRLYRLLDRQLEGREYVAGLYSIADMAIYPWTVLHEKQRQNLPDYPNLMRWYFAMEEREAVERAYDIDD